MPAIISNMMQRYKIYLKNSMFLQDFFKIYNGLNPDKEKKKRRIKKESYNPLNTSRKRLFCKKNRILFGQFCYYQYLCTPESRRQSVPMASIYYLFLNILI